jgi:hypothetical protein
MIPKYRSRGYIIRRPGIKSLDDLVPPLMGGEKLHRNIQNFWHKYNRRDQKNDSFGSVVKLSIVKGRTSIN